MNTQNSQQSIDLDFSRNLFCLLGMPVDATDMEGTVNRLTYSAKQDIPCFLSTPNLNFFIQSLNDDSFTKSIVQSELSIADGNPICWLARILHITVTERVAGSSMFEKLVTRKTSPPIKVIFFGGQDDVAEQAMVRINMLEGGVICVGALNPGMGSIDDMSGEEILSEIYYTNADFIVVSLGAKMGQSWILRSRGNLNAPIVSHLGAVVNFIAGSVKRSPLWMQKSGLEWLWRIKEEPYLWKRYWSDGTKLFRIILRDLIPYMSYKKKLKKSPGYSVPFDILILPRHLHHMDC